MYDDQNVKVTAEANLLIAAVKHELAKGTKHYRKSDNVLLSTDVEILQALVDEGGVIIEIKKESIV